MDSRKALRALSGSLGGILRGHLTASGYVQAFSDTRSRPFCRSPFCPARLLNARFSVEVPSLAMSVSHELQSQTSTLQRSKAFGAGVGSLPVNSRSNTHTDKCNFSIMIVNFKEYTKYKVKQPLIYSLHTNIIPQPTIHGNDLKR